MQRHLQATWRLQSVVFMKTVTLHLPSTTLRRPSRWHICFALGRSWFQNSGRRPVTLTEIPRDCLGPDRQIPGQLIKLRQEDFHTYPLKFIIFYSSLSLYKVYLKSSYKLWRRVLHRKKVKLYEHDVAKASFSSYRCGRSVKALWFLMQL
jgi:hypothetical protein